VSNHGGRQLDGAPASIDTLPAVAGAVAGRIPILLDGGVRRGADVVRAIALGARACLVGRPGLWGLAVAGGAGVRHVLEIYRREIDRVMGLCGLHSIGEINAELLLRGTGTLERAPHSTQLTSAATTEKFPDLTGISRG
jgi:L-lactate dehydrogenase (cytochrome)/(S)-mandelate dehydrogenase